MSRKSIVLAAAGLGIALTGLFSPATADERPTFKSGLYVPPGSEKACKSPNAQSYDFVLALDSEKGTYGDSETVCKFGSWKPAGAKSFQVEMACHSGEETTKSKLVIMTDKLGGKITALDGYPYVWCGSFK